MYPGKAKYVWDAFNKATRDAYGYLLVDLKQTTPDLFRLRGKIFPEENREVYVSSI